MKQSSFNVNKAEDSLGLLLWQTTMTWQRQIKNALEPYDISHAQFVILAILLWLTEQETVPIQSDIINFVVQLNGKKRANINTKVNINEKELLEMILKDKKLEKMFIGKKIEKSFFVKNRLINILVK